MTTRFFATLFLLFIAFTSIAQVGENFPDLEGETLEEKTLSIPESTTGKYTIVGLAYSKRSEDALKSWYQPIYDKFVAKLGMFDGDYDVNLVFVPMFTGTKKLAYSANMKQMKESNRKDLFPYILFYKGEIKSYIETLEMENKNLPYFYVLDPEGKIVHMTQGMFSDSKMEGIEEALEE